MQTRKRAYVGVNAGITIAAAITAAANPTPALAR
jgi:hypothetical protein